MASPQPIVGNSPPDLPARQRLSIGGRPLVRAALIVSWLLPTISWLSGPTLLRAQGPKPTSAGKLERIAKSNSGERIGSVIRWTPVIGSENSSSQLYDRLNAFPTKWFLDSSDCDAKVIQQRHLSDGGIDGRPCEVVRFSASHGSEALFVYPIEPVMAIDSLTATLAVMSVKPGARIGLRVRFPNLINESTHQSESVIVYGASYRDAGQYGRIGVGKIERKLRVQASSLRRDYGIRADLSDPHVDAVVVNAFTGPGTSALRMDELRIRGMVPVGLRRRLGISVEPDSRRVQRRDAEASPSSLESGLRRDDREGQRAARRAFAADRLTKVLQYNGESLSYLRTLGFDGVLLSAPPTKPILREAMTARLAIYAPPPTAPDPEMEVLLDRVAGWSLTATHATDASSFQSIETSAQRVRSFPTPWQRPTLVAPQEDFRRYGPTMDVMVRDLASPIRGVTLDEQLAEIARSAAVVSPQTDLAVGLSSMPPPRLLSQSEAIARSIGAPEPSGFHWHSMLCQAIASLELTPAAMIYRSTRSLTSGTELGTHRAAALSYTNRLLAAIAPWVRGSVRVGALTIRGGVYRGSRLRRSDTDVMLLTSASRRGSELLAGDGTTLAIELAPEDAGKSIWRVTHFSAQRVTPIVDGNGVRLEIVSPDFAEVLFLSEDPGLGSRLSESLSRFANQAAQDRWQLTAKSVRDARQDRTLAEVSGLGSAPGADFLRLAESTLREAEPMIRAGDLREWFRQARRSDAWAARSQWRLAESLMPDWPTPTSSPPVQLGSLSIQSVWRPLMNDDGWGPNRLTAGGLDSPELIAPGRWELGHRLIERADTNVSITSRGAFSGAGALRAIVTPDRGEDLPGGYAGTVVQIKSPAVELKAGTAVRIDAMVRTVGFGGDHQGLLVYDNIGGQESGMLVRGRSSWTPIRLYRQTFADGEVRVMFELIGGGEAVIDEVELSIWNPSPTN